MKNTPLFSKGQRIAIVLLLFLIVAIWLADSLIARFAPLPEAHHKEALIFQSELDSFSAQIQPINRTNYQQKATSTYVDWDAYPTQYQLHPFDPNKADSATLADLGLSVRVIRNILRYREKGGYFNHADLLENIECHTLGGLILQQIQHVPQSGETLIWQDLHLEIVDMDGARIDKVLVKKQPKE